MPRLADLLRRAARRNLVPQADLPGASSRRGSQSLGDNLNRESPPQTAGDLPLIRNGARLMAANWLLRGRGAVALTENESSGVTI
jgi:hypothetical protein